MQRSRARRVAALAVACGVALSSTSARADERTDARREFKVGMEFITEGRYDEGIAHFERAYDLLPHPNVLYNIGIAHVRAGRPEVAIEYLDRYRETMPPNDAAKVETLIASLRAQVAETAATTSAQEAPAAPAEVGRPLEPKERAALIESAAAELRKLADERGDESLRAQADQLERTLSDSSEGAEPTAGGVVKPPEEADKAAAKPASTALAAGASEQTGLYEEQVVSASRFSQSPLDAPNATAIITAQDIRMSGVIQLSQLLRRVAGLEVFSVNPSHSEIGIRGLNRRSSNKVLLLWDGRQIRKDYLGTQWLDMMPILVDDIERIEIIRGPASALYGADAFSGVINIVTRAPGQGGSFAVARIGNHGQYQGGASFSRREGNLRYRASAGYVQLNSTARLASEDRVDITPFDTKNPELSMRNLFANGDVVYSYTDNGTIAVGGNYGGGGGIRTLAGLGRLTQTVSVDAYEAQAYATITTPIGVRLATNYDHVSGDANSGAVAAGSVSDRSGVTLQRLIDVDLSWSGTLKLLVPQTITLGLSYRYKHIDWDWLDTTHSQHHEGIYLQDVIQLARSLRLQVGARADWHPLLAKMQVSPRGSLVWRFLENQSLRLSGGRAFRGPSLMESYLEFANETPRRGLTGYGLGNPNLGPESITSVELGYQNQASDHFSLEANVYHNWIKDLILLTDVDPYTLQDYANDRDGEGLARFNRAAQAFPVSGLGFKNESAVYRQLGAEVGLRLFPIEGLDFYVNYAINDTRPLDKNDVEQPERRDEQSTSLHKINGGIQYRAAFGLEGSVDLSWFSDQVWIEQVSDSTRGIAWKRLDQPSFLMLSARLGYRIYERVELGVSGTNLAFEHKRQHPLALPLDTRILGTAKVRFP